MYRSYTQIWSRCNHQRRLVSRTTATIATLVSVGSSAYYFSGKANIHLDAEEEPQRFVAATQVTAPLGLQGAELKLRQWEFSARYDEDSPEISRWDFTALPSDDNPEEYAAFKLFHSCRGIWSWFGVYDGHIGPETSYWLSCNLIQAVAEYIGPLYVLVNGKCPNEPSAVQIETAFKDGFEVVDRYLVHDTAEEALGIPVRDEGVEALTKAYSGSCATVASYNAATHLLHIGHVGNSRTVLGRRIARPDGRGYAYEVRELTADHTRRSPIDEPRRPAQHPGGQDARDGQTMELNVSRAFGFGKHKWSPDMQKRLADKRLLSPHPDELKTSHNPSLTADPDVSTTKTEPGDFLIVASAGFWSWLTGAEAVGLVGWWLESRGFDPKGSFRNTRRQPLSPKDLPAISHSSPGAPRFRLPQVEPRFVHMDENAATHLLRNALGGANRQQLTTMLNAELEEEIAPQRHVSRSSVL
ncbi:uncharacterized protein PHACADRAFT_29097 [Phanerochaete carnosa HHB-10118-sp]|uniref:PPM-type phosphatase domain-containing protein n=1 Tax=Phanerochaete carnosa (strain HHB-10118-sp) TaxID=650164 RepID=K5VX43_PHACS|nr:uncharacterized protein PHACADRAFT_29097 [Phanerochaete carnosa HHB-10118-sp]EKM56143.1 hypothetical protein PHACADRAFT_29097 [Phanerochaete carnosa HHB-10118-sp]